MKLKRVSKIIWILTVAVFVLTATAFGYSSKGVWSTYKTLDLAGSTAKYTNSSVKMTNKSEFTVYASSKTMSSKPSVTLVNSDGETRGNRIYVSETGSKIIGYTNTGAIGYKYRGKVLAAWNQVGADSIRLKVMSD